MRAVVDIGSNSVKFTVARVERDAPVVLGSGSWITRLGSGSAQRRLLPEAVAKTRHALDEINTALRGFRDEHGAPEVKIVATSAVRDATNPEAVTALAEEILGVPVRVLSGLEEARIAIEGAAAASERVFSHRRSLFFDMGGASTEVGRIEPSFRAHSFQAGAVRCHNAFGFGSAVVDDTAWAKAHREIANFFPAADWDRLFSGASDRAPTAVAVGGTLVLASKLVPTARDHSPAGLVVSLEEVRELGERLRRLDAKDRFQVPHMAEGRADIVVSGLLILEHLLERAGLSEVLVTDWGLRHGLLRDWSLV